MINCGLFLPGRPQKKIKGNEKRKYLDLARELKNLWNMNVMVKPIVILALEMDSKRVCKDAGKVRNQRTSQNHYNHSIVKINKNTEKIPGDVRRLGVTQTPVKGYQLTLVWKTLIERTLEGKIHKDTMEWKVRKM